MLAQRRGAVKRPPPASDARAFSLAWDARLRHVKALGRVETAREAAIAAGALAVAAKEGAPVLLVVDAAREAGVLDRLKAPRVPAG